MVRFLKSLYLNQRLFGGIFGLALIFLFSYWLPWLYPMAWILAVTLLLLTAIDILILYRSAGVLVSRLLPEKFSNADINEVQVKIQNTCSFPVSVEVIDEIPVQFQERDFYRKLKISSGENSSFTYELRPVDRGEYHFGRVNIYLSSVLQLVRRRQVSSSEGLVKVYPSFKQMRKYEFMSVERISARSGLKKIRRIGHTIEFEQIKEYVAGDDIRSMNWKATAKQGAMMVNQYQDERSQPVYSLIDTGRNMKMPFDNLKLLDYAINSSLALSNIALKKKDKAGLVCFSDKLHSFIPASSKKDHLNLLLEKLYRLETGFLDSDFSMLYNSISRKLPQRSLLLLYTNFEHLGSLRRQLPFLLALARKHMLVVIFFENTILEALADSQPTTIPEIFDQTVAQQFSYDKKLMAKALQQRGIQTLLTKPEELMVNTINKYLEIKKRGLL